VAEFLTTLADKLNAPKPRHIPLWLARLVAGQAAVDYFTSSARTSNSKFCQTFGLPPRFSGIQEGLEQVVATFERSLCVSSVCCRFF
jgi:NAD dependent epimerase/dehydratase family enzyme